MTTEQGRELGWNDQIENDGQDFVLLPEGEYQFVVEKFERGRFAGSAKLPPCPMAKLTIKVADHVTVQSNLYLHTVTEGLLCKFFRAIGARQHGQRVAMDWNKVPGARGRCKLGVRTYTGKDGAERKANEIKAFLDPEQPATVSAPAFTAPQPAPAAADDIPF